MSPSNCTAVNVTFSMGVLLKSRNFLAVFSVHSKKNLWNWSPRLNPIPKTKPGGFPSSMVSNYV